jgi:plasmid stabilization system protein ParE
VKLILHPEADAEFLDAQLYYAAADPELGLRFYDEMSALLIRVAEHPLRYKQFDPPARRLFARDFPYAMVYVPRPDIVWIIAVMHVRREPGYWKGRLAESGAAP